MIKKTDNMRITLILITFLFFTFCNSNDQKDILGKWVLSESTFEPISFLGKCDNIRINSHLEFIENQMKIFSNDSLCDSYRFKIYNERLTLFVNDMVVNMKIEKLNKDELVLRSKLIPLLRENEYSADKIFDSYQVKKEGYLLTFKKY